jgi:hypothetical protein
VLTVKMAKAGFFDREAVIKAVNRASLRVLKEYGRRVRRRAQKSLAYGKGTSPPGSPPTAHRSRTVTRKSKSTGKTRKRSVSFLREFLYFAYDASSKSVVIGPARLNGTVDANAPHALEYGGTSTAIDHGKAKKVSIRPHPFMRPADAAERPGLRDLWKDSVR